MPKKDTKPKKKKLPPGWVQSNIEWPESLREGARATAKIDGSRTIAAFVRHAVTDRIRRVREEHGLR